MRMTIASCRIRCYWPEMTILVLLVISPLLLDVSFGQEAACGFAGFVCPEGLCCGNTYVCGNTAAYCGQGNCTSQCPSAPFQCGPFYNNVLCPGDACCSTHSWCGIGNAWCGEGNCSAQCPHNTCELNGGTCPNGSCCRDGYCGNTTGYCGVGSCTSQCPPSPAPTPLGLIPLSPAPTSRGLIPLSPAPTPLGLLPTSGGPSPRGNKLGIIVGIPVGVVAFLIACIVIAFFVTRSGGGNQRRRAFTKEDPTMELDGLLERFSYKQLSVATRAFSLESKLGQGGFGSVYRGVLPSSGIPVAIKKINSDSNQGEKEFMAEVSIISQVRHRNLIQLRGWCKDVAREKYLLVYELMPNGSLDKILFAPAENQIDCLSWPQRLNIVTGTAAAVDYLHQGWKQQVIHRDIKSSNIMLDEEWNAKLGDFGLARLVDHQRAGATTIVAGTYGYIAPEAATSGRFTDKTDVFAFGAVVLEIACGRRAFSAEFPPDEIVLVDWVWERLSERALLSTVDKRLGDYDTYWMEVMLIVGLLCSHPDPVARPSMRHVVQVLAGDAPVPRVPASKPAPVYCSKNISINNLQGRNSKSISKFTTGTISLVPTSTSDQTGGSTSKSLGSSSNSNSSFLAQGSSGDGLG